MEVLYDHDYPGNIRELENALQRAFVLCHGPRIEVAHLPRDWVGSNAPGAPARDWAKASLSVRAILTSAPPCPSATASASVAGRLIAALEANRWNRAATARALGIGRNTLWRRMKEAGLLP
jgi:transcriptional regulator of acetoin/glycerol metabolism